MTAHRNLEVGDIVLLNYHAKYARDKFRLARVTQVLPDQHGDVRTVYVLLADKGTGSSEGEQGGRREMKVPVQRLVLVLPRVEQETKAPASNAEEEELVVEEVNPDPAPVTLEASEPALGEAEATPALPQQEVETRSEVPQPQRVRHIRQATRRMRPESPQVHVELDPPQIRDL